MRSDWPSDVQFFFLFEDHRSFLCSCVHLTQQKNFNSRTLPRYFHPTCTCETPGVFFASWLSLCCWISHKELTQIGCKMQFLAKSNLIVHNPSGEFRSSRPSQTSEYWLLTVCKVIVLFNKKILGPSRTIKRVFTWVHLIFIFRMCGNHQQIQSGHISFAPVTSSGLDFLCCQSLNSCRPSLKMLRNCLLYTHTHVNTAWWFKLSSNH